MELHHFDRVSGCTSFTGSADRVFELWSEVTTSRGAGFAPVCASGGGCHSLLVGRNVSLRNCYRAGINIHIVCRVSRFSEQSNWSYKWTSLSWRTSSRTSPPFSAPSTSSRVLLGRSAASSAARGLNWLFGGGNGVRRSPADLFSLYPIFRSCLRRVASSREIP